MPARRASMPPPALTIISPCWIYLYLCQVANAVELLVAFCCKPMASETKQPPLLYQ
jgi:hypothetical protein